MLVLTSLYNFISNYVYKSPIFSETIVEKSFEFFSHDKYSEIFFNCLLILLLEVEILIFQEN